MTQSEENRVVLEVGVYLYGESLQIQDITRMLGRVPDRAHRKGDPVISKSPNVGPQKIGLWEIHTKCDADSFDDHVSKFLLELPPIQLTSLPGVDEAHLDIHASGLRLGDGYSFLDFALSSDLILKLASLNLSVRISIVN